MERKARDAEGQESHAHQPEPADTEQQIQLPGRRDFLKKTAVAAATAVAAVYIVPQIETLVGSQVAHAKGSYTTHPPPSLPPGPPE